MKGFFLILLTTFIFPVNQLFSQWKKCDDIPLINVSIINTASKKINKKVGNGQSHDFIEGIFKPLDIVFDEDLSKAAIEIDAESYCVYPGDLVFVDNLNITQSIDDLELDPVDWVSHYAIVSEVLEGGVYYLIHQNCLPGARVIVTKIRVTDENRAAIKFFRIR